MASEAGHADGPVTDPARAAIRELLLREGPRFGFFQAVRLIQACFPEAPRVGFQGPASQECLRFRGDLSLSFPPADIREVREAPCASAGEPRLEITASFLGLYGPASPLPTFYTEDLLDEDPEENLVRRLLDLFHHRAYSLFYRAWEKYRYEVQFRSEGRDPITRRLLCLAGLEPKKGLPAGEIPRLRLLAYAGLLTQRPRSASALEGVLRDYFGGIPLSIEQCVPQRLEIPEASRNRLGGSCCRLDVDLSLGERILDRSSTFRIRLGPLGRQEFQEFLPNRRKRRQLEEIVDVFVSDTLDFELEVWIHGEETPSIHLGGEREQLGWSTWLGDRPGSDQWVRFLIQRGRTGSVGSTPMPRGLPAD